MTEPARNDYLAAPFARWLNLGAAGRIAGSFSRKHGAAARIVDAHIEALEGIPYSVVVEMRHYRYCLETEGMASRYYIDGVGGGDYPIAFSSFWKGGADRVRGFGAK